jgi:hypothetical protein
MPDTTIPPALTPEEWRDWLDTGQACFRCGDPHAHGDAAAALYGQPFGFTRADVVTLIHFGDTLDVAEGVRPYFYGLAARIAALLPPAPSE